MLCLLQNTGKENFVGGVFCFWIYMFIYMRVFFSFFLGWGWGRGN